MPRMPTFSPSGLFSQIIRNHFHNPELFDRAVRGLFQQMAGGGLFGADEVAYFNGDLFNTADTVEFSLNALYLLNQAAERNWRNIEPSIFGTLFERALDASKRSQLGAHYTGAADIDLVVEPVLMEPLRREWEAAEGEVNRLISDGDDAAARDRLAAFQRRLTSVTVLDPACGSGNFLYIALRSLLDLEKQVIDFNDALSLSKGWEEMYPQVRPNQMLGLEINPYAAELARSALWIGYIQWHQANGIHYRQSPILTPMDTIRQTDAILADGDTANPRETEWPAAEFIIGNPPFLGGKLLRSHLGDEHVDALFRPYRGRVPAEVDIVCYWFEKARAQIADGKSRRAGLLATQGIRGGANRRVLQRIKESGDIFLAWSDQPWILEGAAVRTSIVGFDDGSESNRTLDGVAVESINSNLTSGADLTAARPLSDNLSTAFQGPVKVGAFDIPRELAHEMLSSPNPHHKSNKDVLYPWLNGRDITDRPRGMWIIDFRDMTEQQAALYEAPFEYVNEHIRPQRIENRDRQRRTFWWRLGRSGDDLRTAVEARRRFIVTPRVSKHRLFVWVEKDTLPDSATIAIARDDELHLRRPPLPIPRSLGISDGNAVGKSSSLHPHHLLRDLPLPGTRRRPMRRHRPSRRPPQRAAGGLAEPGGRRRQPRPSTERPGRAAR